MCRQVSKSFCFECGNVKKRSKASSKLSDIEVEFIDLYFLKLNTTLIIKNQPKLPLQFELPKTVP